MITPAYVEQLRLLHKQRLWGASGHSHARTIADWCRVTGAKTVLDYGCGTGTLKPALIARNPKLLVQEYDPGIPGKDLPPTVADMLVATDVLEHIEPQYVHDTLDILRVLARKAAFFTIALTLSKVSLPDGRNAHLSLMPDSAWRADLCDAGFTIERAELRKGLWIWAR